MTALPNEALLSAIVERLSEAVPEFWVDNYPSNQSRFEWGSANQHLLVAPEGSTFGAEPGSTSPLAIDEIVRVSVTVLARDLRGDLGAVTTLARIRRALFGWRPRLDGELLGFGPLLPERAGFVSEGHGIWRWVIVFRAATVAVAESAPLAGPPLKSVETKEIQC